jgi:hypothetical protein
MKIKFTLATVVKTCVSKRSDFGKQYKGDIKTAYLLGNCWQLFVSVL